ncbi:Sensor histidine kinase RcsC [Brevundimonas sp. NIBR10]|uniref:sensor histidine kinase n=1 Tax=Brevundimonas sp. NIBR10 TaxID=3015997 RepID=UPI0022F14FC5|nr:HAMP domain-containing sensor histidine kinase [Brevundimonas sp. NIBR10]WGM45938.1 Sensor histidine kinase RcsC [Brevundimonas sp. NIBR10]
MSRSHGRDNPSIVTSLIAGSVAATALSLFILILAPIGSYAARFDRTDISLNLLVADARDAIAPDGRIDRSRLEASDVLMRTRRANPELRLFIDTPRDRFTIGGPPRRWREPAAPQDGASACGVETTALDIRDADGAGRVQARRCDEAPYYIEVGAVRTAVVTRREAFGSVFRTELTRYGQSLALVALFVGLVILTVFYLATRSLRAVVAIADHLGPDGVLTPLPEARLPREILPLVRSVNRAFFQIEDAVRRQKTFTAAAAHELRTPLAILGGRLGELPEGALRHQLERDVRRMSQIISQLLKLASWQAVAPRLDPISLNGLVREVCIEYAPIAIAAGKSLTYVEDGSAMIAGDAEIVRIAVVNLMENALLHTAPATAVEVTVGADRQVRIRDHGAGVAEADRPHLFKPFFKQPPNKAGAGLGLAIVSEAMTLHGGQISVETPQDGGAAFVLAFPPIDSGPDDPAR